MCSGLTDWLFRTVKVSGEVTQVMQFETRIRFESLRQRCTVAQVFLVPGVALVLSTHAGPISFTPLFFSKEQLEVTFGAARKLAIRASQLRRAAGRRRFQGRLNATAAQLSGARAPLYSLPRACFFMHPYTCSNQADVDTVHSIRHPQSVDVPRGDAACLFNIRYTSAHAASSRARLPL